MSSFTYRYDVDLWIGSTIKDASILLEEFFIIAKNVQIKVKKNTKMQKTKQFSTKYAIFIF